MWVDIANLMGPRGQDGKDGLQGPQGPVNVGLNPNEPISWDQSGGITFNLVDGTHQTVNLPIASAQSAGLLGAGGSLPTTGLRNIGSLVAGFSAGDVELIRTGPIVTLSASGLEANGISNGAVFLTLPLGFRATTNLYTESTDYWVAETITFPVRLARNGGISARASGNLKFSFGFSYITTDDWPNSLPGTAA